MSEDGDIELYRVTWTEGLTTDGKVLVAWNSALCCVYPESEV